MDTKLKKSKPLLAWLCFFFGVSIVFSLTVTGISQARDIYENYDDITAAVRSDVKDMSEFKQEVAGFFEILCDAVNYVYVYGKPDVSSLQNEGENLVYYATNTKTGETFTNSDPGVILRGNPVSLPKGYDYYLYYDGSHFFIEKAGKMLDINKNGYGALLGSYMQDGVAYPDVRVLLIVKKDLVDMVNANSYLYQIKSKADIMKWMNLGFAFLMVAGIALLAAAIFGWKAKREFENKIARLSGILVFEIKAIVTSLTVAFLIWGWYGPGGFTYSYSDFFWDLRFRSFGVRDHTLIYFVALCCFWWLYAMFLDLLRSRKRFFTHNSVDWLIGHYHTFENQKPFLKKMIWRIYLLIAAELLSLILASLAVAAHGNTAWLSILFVAAGVYILYRYLRRYFKTARDTSLLLDRIESLENGKTLHEYSFSPDSDLLEAGERLDRIQEGLQRTINERIKSERLKAELVANVSHDLKTPLTSIISYVDLLSREEDLPDHVKEYIKILSQKSDRLKTLIQDLFDLSKASSGAIELDMENIDLGKLIRQTLADMDEQIQKSDLTFKISLPEAPVIIKSDGNKLYRVFLNLITNVLKYSLKGSRVYIDLSGSEDGRAVVEIKNVSNYEMNFKEDEILERFARGDKARSSEGSGLGLAIAQSFTTACGGSFGIKVDGDLFKARLAFGINNNM